MVNMLDARAKEIFSLALELRGSDRDELVRSESAGNSTLHARVMDLLRAAEQEDAFLSASESCEHAPSLSLHHAVDEEQPGSLIGHYRILNLIGEGGFGSVYRAEQISPVRREVALKVIKLGMDTRSVVARFEQERQALALMDHANIAKVLDAGATRSGRPYFVMELVGGEPITRYCDAHSVPIRDRLELFCQVCHAVQHAHTKGVIHRDIKPANILVCEQDGRPICRVIDFGVAKAIYRPLTEHSLHTELRQFIGTPEYMSPEQASGSLDVDTRSDVYALGVVLYELLAGAPPLGSERLRSASLQDLQRIIRDEEPPPPSTRLTASQDDLREIAARRAIDPRRLAPLLRGDLDLIVMRSLEKDRARRYDSPGNLAADIQRHLRGEVIEAAPPGVAYRTRKFAARHRSFVTASLVVFLALLAGLGATLWQAREARRAAIVAENLRADTDRIARFQAARLKGLDLQSAGLQIRASLLENASPEVVRSLAGVNFTDIARGSLEQSIFEDAIAAARTEFDDAPALKAQMLVSIGETMTGLGMGRTADDALLEGLNIRRRELGDDHPATLMALSILGVNRLSLGRNAEAEQFCREAAERSAAVLGADHEVTLTTQSNLGACMLRTSRFAEAEAVYRHVRERRLAVSGPDHLGTIRATGSLATVLHSLGRRDEASPLAQETYEAMRRVRGEDHADTIRAAQVFTDDLYFGNRYREAESLMRTYSALSRKTLGSSHPTTLKWISTLARSLAIRNPKVSGNNTVGDLPFSPDEIRSGLVEAETLYRELVSSYTDLFGPDSRNTLEARAHLGSCLAMLGRNEEAVLEFEQTLARQIATGGPNSISVVMTRAQFGPVLTTVGRFAEAESQLLEVERAMSGHGPSALAHRELARLYDAWEQTEPGRGFAAKAKFHREKLKEASK